MINKKYSYSFSRGREDAYYGLPTLIFDDNAYAQGYEQGLFDGENERVYYDLIINQYDDYIAVLLKEQK